MMLRDEKKPTKKRKIDDAPFSPAKKSKHDESHIPSASPDKQDNDENANRTSDDIVCNLPFEVSTGDLANRMDIKSLFTARQVCYQWSLIFSDKYVWKSRLQKDFGFSTDLLKQNTSGNLRFLCRSLYSLEMRLPNHWKPYLHSHFQPQLAVCLSKNGEQALAEIPVDNHFFYLNIALYANNSAVYEKFFEHYKNSVAALYFLELSMEAKNTAAVKYLLKQANGFHFIVQPKQIPVSMRTYFSKPNYTLQNVYQWTLIEAAKSGNLELVTFLFDPKNPFNVKSNNEILNMAAATGHLALVQFLLEQNDKLNISLETVNKAARSGKLELVKYLLARNNIMPKISTLNAAVRSGNLELVKFILEKNTTLKPDIKTLNFAAETGDVPLFNFLKQFINPTYSTFDKAVCSGNLELIKLLHTSDCWVTSTTMDTVASKGYLEVMKFILDKKNNIRSQDNSTGTARLKTLEDAVKAGHLEMVKLLTTPTENSDQVLATREILEVAANLGHVEIVEYFLRPLNPYLCVTMLKTLLNIDYVIAERAEPRVKEAYSCIICTIKVVLDFIDAFIAPISRPKSEILANFSILHDMNPLQFFRVITAFLFSNLDTVNAEDCASILETLASIINENKYSPAQAHEISQCLHKLKEGLNNQFNQHIDDIVKNLYEPKNAIDTTRPSYNACSN